MAYAAHKEIFKSSTVSICLPKSASGLTGDLTRAFSFAIEKGNHPVRKKLNPGILHVQLGQTVAFLQISPMVQMEYTGKNKVY